MKIVFSLLTLMILTAACEQGDEDRMAQAQACLDRSTQANVSECELIVSGISGPRAGLIRCSANFITQGFTGAKFANAFTALKTNTSGFNSTLSMMSYLVFTVGADQTARLSATSVAVQNCTESGLAGMIMFANFARAATILSSGLTITPGTSPTPTELRDNLASITSSTDTELGTAVLSISSIYCSSTSSTKDVNFCAMVNSAAASGSAASVGSQMRTLLAQNS